MVSALDSGSSGLGSSWVIVLCSWARLPWVPEVLFVFKQRSRDFFLCSFNSLDISRTNWSQGGARHLTTHSASLHPGVY